MLDGLNSVLMHLSAWGASCVCHRTRTKELLAEQGFRETCPMSGRRAPELACGGVHTFFREAVEMHAGNMVLAFSAELNDDQRARLIADFEMGHRLEVKPSLCRRLILR